MPVLIEKSFEVEQPVDEVWGFLTDPERIVECLPGARLIEKVDESTFRGEIVLKLGPLSTRFLGVITFDEVDRDRHSVILTGKGRERRGAGNVSMSMRSRLRALPDGGTRVGVAQSISLTGRLAAFGRGGVIQSVSNVMFERFLGCVRRKLAS